MRRPSSLPEWIIKALSGDCTKKIGSMMNIMKPGTPAGLQLERAAKAIFRAGTFSFSLFMASLAQGFRLGLPRSAIPKGGWAPGFLGAEGGAGSLRGGPGPPGTAMKSGFVAIQPTWFEEKSGIGDFCCA